MYSYRRDDDAARYLRKYADYTGTPFMISFLPSSFQTLMIISEPICIFSLSLSLSLSLFCVYAKNAMLVCPS